MRVATAESAQWIPIWREPPPVGVKLMLLTNARVATIGNYDPALNFVAWSPLPKETAEIKEYFRTGQIPV